MSDIINLKPHASSSLFTSTCCHYKINLKACKFKNVYYTPKSRGFLKNSSSFDFDALNVALNDARLIDLNIHKSKLTQVTNTKQILTTKHNYQQHISI